MAKVANDRDLYAVDYETIKKMVGTEEPKGTAAAVGGASNGPMKTGYTPAGTFNDAILSEADRATIDKLRSQYNASIAAGGDPALENALHAAAEAVRAKYGYSGGGDGSQYIGLEKTTPTVSIPSQVVGADKDNKPTYDYHTVQAAKPDYTSNYSARIDAMLNDILNRDAFSYNAEEDDLFQQYKTQYQREGNRAMKDTLGQASARTGGLASSYATSAAQQANQYYAQQLSDKIPELYQLAYEMYLSDIDNKVRDLGLLQEMDNTQYNRYRDTMSDWRDDRDFSYGMYRDDMGDYQWQTGFDEDVRQWQESFDYGKERDKIADQRYDTEWAHQVAQDALAQSNWQKEFDAANSQWEKEYALAAAKQAASGSGSSGNGYTGSKSSSSKSSGSKSSSSKSSGSSGYTGKTSSSSSTKSTSSDGNNLTIDSASVLALGYGPISMTRLDELVSSGAVTEYTDGNKIKFKKNTSNVSWPSPFNWNY